MNIQILQKNIINFIFDKNINIDIIEEMQKKMNLIKKKEIAQFRLYQKMIF